MSAPSPVESVEPLKRRLAGLRGIGEAYFDHRGELPGVHEQIAGMHVAVKPQRRARPRRGGESRLPHGEGGGLVNVLAAARQPFEEDIGT